MIPEPMARWVTTNVSDHFYPYLLILEYQSLEIQKARKLIFKMIAEESDRRLELIRKVFTSPPGSFDSILGAIEDIETDLEAWR